MFLVATELFITWDPAETVCTYYIPAEWKMYNIECIAILMYNFEDHSDQKEPERFRFIIVYLKISIFSTQSNRKKP